MRGRDALVTVTMTVMLCAPGVVGAMSWKKNREVPGLCSKCRPAPPCHAQPCTSWAGTSGVVPTMTPSTWQRGTCDTPGA